MERILSKDEIAELLSAIRDGDLDVSPRTEEQSVEEPPQATRLDLVNVPRKRHYRIDNLDIVLDTFARNFGITLANRLQRSLSVKRSGLQAFGFEDFLQQIPSNDPIAILEMKPLRGAGLLIFSKTLAFFMVERLLGGYSNQVNPLPERALTAIEKNIIRNTVEDACHDLEKTFLPVEKLLCTMIKLENNPRMVNIVPPDAQVIVGQFSVAFGDRQGEVTLVLPQASLEPLREKMREKLGPFAKSQDKAWDGNLRRALQSMETELSVQLATVRLRVRDVLNLQVGDIIDLGCDLNDTLILRVEGKAKFRAQAGTRNDKTAVRVLERIHH
jgi:flagellar motor switch protein FliM